MWPSPSTDTTGSLAFLPNIFTQRHLATCPLHEQPAADHRWNPSITAHLTATAIGDGASTSYPTIMPTNGAGQDPPEEWKPRDMEGEMRALCAGLKSKVDKFLDSEPSDELSRNVQRQVRLAKGIIDDALTRYRSVLLLTFLSVSLLHQAALIHTEPMLTMLCSKTGRAGPFLQRRERLPRALDPDPGVATRPLPAAAVDAAAAALVVQHALVPGPPASDLHTADEPVRGGRLVRGPDVAGVPPRPRDERQAHEAGAAGLPAGDVRGQGRVRGHAADRPPRQGPEPFPGDGRGLAEVHEDTSCGTDDTHPNPALKAGESEKTDGFKPAYELTEDHEERLGRDF
ncbi:hypothetical protein SCARD494_06041 [Seiridium cardinale]